MSNNKLRDWFNPPPKAEQSVPSILAHMALTVLSPDHRHAYRGDSCYGTCAHEIKKMREIGHVPEDISIALYGTPGGLVMNVVLARDGLIIKDTENPDNNGKTKAAENLPYHNGMILKKLADVGMESFQTDYLDRIVITGSKPSGPTPNP